MTPTPKENLLRAIRFEDPCYVPYSGEGVLRLVDHRGRKPPRAGTDEWGVTFAPLPESYQAGPDEPAESCAVAYPCASLRDVLAHPFPHVADPGLFAGLLDGVDVRTTLPVGHHPAGPFDRLSQLLGPMEAWLGLSRDPITGREALDRLADYHVRIARGYIAAGVEAGWIGDDYAGQDGPFMRPAVWRQTVLPGLARVFDVYCSAGLPVFFHTCGRVRDLIPDLLDAGATVFNLETTAADLPALRARFGKQIAFYGGVSAALMLRGAPDEVRRAAREAIIRLGADGGLVLAPDQPLVFPEENERALAETARQFGYYPVEVGV